MGGKNAIYKKKTKQREKGMPVNGRKGRKKRKEMVRDRQQAITPARTLPIIK